MYTRTYLCIYTCVYIHGGCVGLHPICLCIFIYTHTQIYLYMHVYRRLMCKTICIYTYTHTHTYLHGCYSDTYVRVQAGKQLNTLQLHRLTTSRPLLTPGKSGKR